MAQDTKTNTADKKSGGAAGSDGMGAGAASSASSSSSTGSDKKGSDQQESLLEKFFTDALKDMYYAEQHILKALPKMEEAATTDELKDAFNDHAHITQKHVKRLEKVFSIIGQKPEAKKCEAIEGIVKESETIIKETKEGSMTRDAALIIAAQKVEHYEIATYGGLVQLAITLGFDDAADLLDKTLSEEEDTDRSLTEIAEAHINMEAEEEDNFSMNKKKKAATAMAGQEEE